VSEDAKVQQHRRENARPCRTETVATFCAGEKKKKKKQDGFWAEIPTKKKSVPKKKFYTKNIV